MPQAEAGTVKMDDKNYTEMLSYESEPSFLNKSAVYTYRIEGNKWYIKGGVGDMKLEEEWQRLK